MYQKTWINILLVGFLALPLFRDCCVSTLQVPMPNCPHHSSEPKNDIASCPAMDVRATVEKQFDLGSIAFQSVAALFEAMFIAPLELMKVQLEHRTLPATPIPLYLHTNALLI